MNFQSFLKLGSLEDQWGRSEYNTETLQSRANANITETSLCQSLKQLWQQKVQSVTSTKLWHDLGWDVCLGILLLPFKLGIYTAKKITQPSLIYQLCTYQCGRSHQRIMGIKFWKIFCVESASWDVNVTRVVDGSFWNFLSKEIDPFCGSNVI